MKRFSALLFTFFGILNLLTPQLANAQAWGAAGPQPVVYPLLQGADEQLGDGSNAHGGVPPAQSLVAPIASNFDVTLWMDPGCRVAGTGDCLGYTHQVVDPNTEESKFRTHCNTAKVGWFDPILFPGMANAGHPHLFFGNTGTNKDSTYESLRTTGDSTCGGGQINRSAYWVPCLMFGPNKCLKSDAQTVYYNQPKAAFRNTLVLVPTAFKYVGGKNPADMNDTAVLAEVAANNNRPGQTANYVADTGGQSWEVVTADGANFAQGPDAPNPNANGQPYFRSKDGSWTMTVPAGAQLFMNIDMPTCIDGKNLSSPDARQHVRYEVLETHTNKHYCPIGWYRIPRFLMRAQYSVTEAELRTGNIYLSSDRMSTDPTKWFAPGSTLHNDWFGAWDPDIMKTWQTKCNGTQDIPGFPASPNGAEGVDTAYCDGRRGITGGALSPTGRFPQLDLAMRWNKKGVYRYFPVTKPVGPVMNMSGHGVTK